MNFSIAHLSPDDIDHIQQLEQELGRRLHKRISLIAYELSDGADDEVASLAPEPHSEDPAASVGVSETEAQDYDGTLSSEADTWVKSHIQEERDEH